MINILLLIIIFVSGFSFIYVYIQKDEVYFKVQQKINFQTFFLLSFMLIIVGSFTFDFIENSSFLSSLVSLIASIQFHLILCSLGFGLFAFYLYKEQIEAEVNTKRESEIMSDWNGISVQDFIFLTMSDLNNSISNSWNKSEYGVFIFRLLTAPFFLISSLLYCSIKQMSKEGQWHNAVLIIIFALFFITRLYDNHFINGSDNYNVLGIKNLYENGFSFYKYSPITDYFMLHVIKTIGFSLLTIKIPFLFYSFVTLIFIYLIGKLISKDLALLSSFLYVISPWAIIQSRITRDYSFDLMVGSIVVFFCFIIYKKIHETSEWKSILRYLVFFSFVPLLVLFLYNYNRSQTLTVGIYVLFSSVFVLEYLIIKLINNKKYTLILYWIIICSTLFVSLFLIDKFPFDFGFKNPNFSFINIFFKASFDSPWQWFHNLNLKIIFLFGLFFFGSFSFEPNKLPKRYLLILLSSFVFGLLLFTLKYESHLNYIPVRYLYFLFLPYVLLAANAVLNLVKLFKGKYQKITLIMLLVFMINPAALIYSISPSLAYEEQGITNLQIDNIGIGRFNLLEVVDYLENELCVNNDTVLVFDGRYGEFILYLNRPMDKERSLVRSSNRIYDIAKNTYVQSNYFGYFELKKAVLENSKGVYVVNDNFIYNESSALEMELKDCDFYLYDTLFNYSETVNDFRIYTWDTIVPNSTNHTFYL
jgi:hypothetical protein